MLKHHAKGLSFQILVALYHYLLELLKVIYKQDLLYNLPLVLIGFGLLARTQELLLADADVFEQRLHEGVNQCSELFVNHVLLLPVVLLLLLTLLM